MAFIQLLKCYADNMGSNVVANAKAWVLPMVLSILPGGEMPSGRNLQKAQYNQDKGGGRGNSCW